MNRVTTKAILALVVLVTAFGGSAALAQNTAALPGGKAEAVYKDIKVLQGIPADHLIPSMQFFEASLGVGCNFCHMPDRAADTPTKTTARQMIQMVKAINRDNFKGQREVTCNTCHRGQAEPVANPALANEKYKPWDPESPNGAPGLPPVAGPPASQLIDNYLKTLGGEANLSKISSRVVKYTATNTEGAAANMEMVSKGESALTITHQGDGDVIIGRGASNGWQRAANGAVRDARENETDESRLQDPLYVATHLKQITGLETRRVRLDDQDVYQLRGMAFGRVPVRLFFHPKTGNLLRLVYLLQNPIGQNVVRIDYSDYRNVPGGSRFPFEWTVARPLGLQTVKVEQVQQNVAVEDTRFAKPAPPAR
ncbi:MAG TPA: photosynthetic reaction center cytochrome c subunit family protein [Terriglobia bacterium]|nr:photosynthetic reaction center cytochrome c subunit family protein [Terriglobia bacterium]